MSLGSDAQISLFKAPPLEVPDHLAAQPRETIGKEQVREQLDDEVAEALRTGKPLSVITADINALKAVNDEMGHDDGDALIGLVETIVDIVPKTLRTKVIEEERPTDIISVSPINYAKFEDLEPETKGTTAARVGGDEFVIILPDTDEAGAQVVIERIREAINTYLDGPGGDEFRKRAINVGVALGASTLDHTRTETAGSDLLSKSDAAMYEDKMSQVRPLTPEQVEHVLASLKHLSDAEIRPRDLPRYVDWLGAQALLDARPEETEGNQD